MKTLTITCTAKMTTYLEQVWSLLVESYASVAGGLHFSSADELLTSTQRWRVVLRHGKVLAVTIFKAKYGYKLSAMAICRKQADRSRRALQHLIVSDLSSTWMEVSEKAEAFVLKHCGGQHFIIHASFASTLLGKMVNFQEGGFHYQREVAGLVKTKLLVGTPLF